MSFFKGFETAISIEDLKYEDHSEVICYPRSEEAEFRNRVEELRRLEIRSLCLSGPLSLAKNSVLGKGCVSIVVEAELGGEPCALKIRRTDANRPNMSHEARMLETANEIHVGPKLFGHTANFLAMELMRGPTIDLWIKQLRDHGTRSRLRRTIGDLMVQCKALDTRRLDHGELSRATKHVHIENDETPKLIDFETASLLRRPANVTAISQYLFIGGAPSPRLRRLLGNVNEKKLIEALKLYKQHPDDRRFNAITKSAKLSS